MSSSTTHRGVYSILIGCYNILTSHSTTLNADQGHFNQLLALVEAKQPGVLRFTSTPAICVRRERTYR